MCHAVLRGVEGSSSGEIERPRKPGDQFEMDKQHGDGRLVPHTGSVAATARVDNRAAMQAAIGSKRRR